MSKNTRRRAATQADVDEGTAVFWIPDSRSRIYDLGRQLPANAVVTVDMEVGTAGDLIAAGTRVSVIQSEIVDERDILLGFSYSEGVGVCALDQVRFV